jgi:O-antigen/teichoic acid export membrane protein
VPYDFVPLVRSSGNLFPASFMDQIVQPWAAVVALGIWSDAIAIGWFVAANRVAALIGFSILPISGILAPKISALAIDNDYTTIWRLSTNATVLMIGTSLPAIVVLLGWPHEAMSVFGGDFLGASTLLIVLVLGQIVNSITGPARVMLIMTGNEKLYRHASVLGGTMVLLLCLLFVPAYGAVAAAWATTAGLVVTKCIAVTMALLKLEKTTTEVA